VEERDNYLIGKPWLPTGFEFLAGIPEPERQRRLLLAIQAYIDDSGVIGTDPVFVLAGFIGKAQKWAEFSSTWEAYLKEPPSIAYLKMQEAVKLDGEFRFWNNGARDKKLHGCVDIIKAHAPKYAIHCTIDLDAFKKRQSRYRKLGPVSHPYLLGCHVVLSGVCYEILDCGDKDGIEIIFDNQVIFAPRLKLWYPMIVEGLTASENTTLRDLGRTLPPDPMFRDDKEYRPLQAADMLAWLFRMAFSGKRNEFEWIAKELSSVVPISQYATVLDGERMDRQHTLSSDVTISPRLLQKWSDTLGLGRSRKNGI